VKSLILNLHSEVSAYDQHYDAFKLYTTGSTFCCLDGMAFDCPQNELTGM
jgi:hypothetical protein